MSMIPPVMFGVNMQDARLGFGCGQMQPTTDFNIMEHLGLALGPAAFHH